MSPLSIKKIRLYVKSGHHVNCCSAFFFLLLQFLFSRPKESHQPKKAKEKKREKKEKKRKRLGLVPSSRSILEKK